MGLLFFIAGLALLVLGGELLVRGASRLAGALGIPRLIIGLTVVAFGTSSPELAVSVKSALTGSADIALGNVVGSNIFNVLFILGLSALITPLVCSVRLLRLDVPLMVLFSVIVLVLALDHRVGRFDGLFLLASLLVYVAFLIVQGRREPADVQGEFDQAFGEERSGGRGTLANIALVAFGLVLLVVGSRWLVQSATDFAQRLGVSELVVGLTIVAAGTSLPEVVTSIVAALRGERDIAVGNVIGSNLFNIMGVLGAAAVVAPEGIGVTPAVIGFDLPVMIVVAAACLPVFFTGGDISRLEGAILFVYYIAYTTYLVLYATGHDALPEFSLVMVAFVTPLTLLILGILVWQEVQRRRARPP
ncbi:calcium/sodium antiporter [Lentisalinibacter salinarum]|uniref:calcium/sodium antiporter n=1 Tax=Lentisalinibacter salinarum TaxID=2992239 RepID=UPI003864B98C